MRFGSNVHISTSKSQLIEKITLSWISILYIAEKDFPKLQKYTCSFLTDGRRMWKNNNVLDVYQRVNWSLINNAICVELRDFVSPLGTLNSLTLPGVQSAWHTIVVSTWDHTVWEGRNMFTGDTGQHMNQSSATGVWPYLFLVFSLLVDFFNHECWRK